MVLPEDGLYIYDENIKIAIRRDSYIKNQDLKCKSTEVLFDFEKIKFPLIVRGVHEGDKFVPFGMKGTKLLSDFMIDTKMNFVDKKKQLILTDGDDNILWIIGRRATDKFRVTDRTKKVLHISILTI